MARRVRAKQKPARGGARKGAGRPPKSPEDRVQRATLSVGLPIELHERLMRAVTEREESAGAIVRAALERELG